jgi:hypothetical protein
MSCYCKCPCMRVHMCMCAPPPLRSAPPYMHAPVCRYEVELLRLSTSGPDALTQVGHLSMQACMHGAPPPRPARPFIISHLDEKNTAVPCAGSHGMCTAGMCTCSAAGRLCMVHLRPLHAGQAWRAWMLCAVAAAGH